jgi:hypothetical protein
MVEARMRAIVDGAPPARPAPPLGQDRRRTPLATGARIVGEDVIAELDAAPRRRSPNGAAARRRSTMLRA